MLKSIRFRQRTISSKFLSVVTILRKQKNIIQIGDMPLRTMPIGIYVIGEISEEEIETARVFKDYYRAYGLGDFRIIKVNPEKYTIDYTKFSRTYNENILLTSIASWYEEICAVIQRSR